MLCVRPLHGNRLWRLYGLTQAEPVARLKSNQKRRPPGAEESRQLEQFQQVEVVQGNCQRRCTLGDTGRNFREAPMWQSCRFFDRLRVDPSGEPNVGGNFCLDIKSQIPVDRNDIGMNYRVLSPRIPATSFAQLARAFRKY